jgi:hypothetical protein
MAGEISASSLSELRAKLAEMRPDAEFRFALSRAAKVEVARRRGVPVAMGWT